MKKDASTANPSAVEAVCWRTLEAPLGLALTPAFGYAASPALSPDEQQLLYVHHYEGQDSLALCQTKGSRWPTRLASGADFYMQPTWHPNGEKVAWVEWDHPQMPWDGTRLMLASLTLEEGVCVNKDTQLIVGDTETAIFQPLFSPD
ncbi:MAG: hypothetical protein JRH20_25020, partial [Deltaproteobacteria bacterium]|nr:hypothetical protein [Deltaproteobacteria bacterium]